LSNSTTSFNLNWGFTDSLLIVNGNINGNYYTLWDYHNNKLSFSRVFDTSTVIGDWNEYGDVIKLNNDSLVISPKLIEDYMLWGEDPIQFTDLQITEYFIRN
jgi:hypothetical protein